MIAPSTASEVSVGEALPINMSSVDAQPSHIALRDVLALTKPRLMSLVLCTTAGGMSLAGSHVFSRLGAYTLGGTCLAVAGAHTLNSWWERDLDALMQRTCKRPLPAGRIAPRVALFLGIMFSLVSMPVLFLGVNTLTGFLGLIASLSYVVMYTPMKTRTPAAVYVGAIPGALPPLMGWTAATGRLGAPGVVLFAILFVWQLPHFLAIAMHCKDDYARAGMKMLPHVAGDIVTARQITLWTWLLVPVTLTLVPLGLAGRVYTGAAVVLGALFVGIALPGLKGTVSPQWPRRVFLFSLVYLTGLFAALAFDAH
jgi:heme o synthase